MRGTKPEHDELDAAAGRIGLDRAAFTAKLASTSFAGETEQMVKASEAEAAKFEANRTPTFYFNGHPLVGALPYDQMRAMVDREIGLADAALARGVPKDHLYDELTRTGFEDNYLRDAVAYKIDIADSPARGPSDALVTMVLFSDFECPFCGELEPVITQLLAAHPADVRVVWKNFPLPMHAHAEPAAEAALAAGEQGKFWEMHDLMFKNQKKLERADLDGYAKTLGLDPTKFADAVDHSRGKPVLDRDNALGGKLGVSGTPGLFLNGKQFDGEKTFAILDAVVTSESKRAAEVVAKGTPRAQIYEALMRDAKVPNAAPPPADTASSKPTPEDKTVYHIDVGQSYSKGPATAPVTIIQFSDFQCPYCAQVEPTLAQIEHAYKDRVRIVWKNYPLDFHKNALPAAEAAMAAGAQGKFWAMHDLLFAQQEALEKPGPDLEKYAQQIGLDMTKFRAAMKSHTYLAAIQAEMAQAKVLGQNGTPFFVINGHKVEGALPFDEFKPLIDGAPKDTGTAPGTAPPAPGTAPTPGTAPPAPGTAPPAPGTAPPAPASPPHASR
jgi:protein-disulfide isomerase